LIAATRIRNRLFLSFVPYAAVGVAHLAGLFFGIVPLEQATKPFLMPALLIGFLVTIPVRAGAVALIGSIGFLLSWAGDVLLASPGNIGFLLGLASFLLSHVVFTVLFLRYTRVRRMPWLAVLIAVWWVGLTVLLAPSIGALLAPVVVYGLVLGFYFATSLGCNRYLSLGAFLVLVSDSILAFKLFLPGFSLWEHDFVIMLPYIVGQALVAIGLVVAVTRRSDASIAKVGA
jgi:uncharacterized membrane protein YhhN